MIRRNVIGISLITSCFLWSCGTPKSNSSLSAYVSPSQARQAFAALASIDYLPFGYKHDGCYARSLFMSMELAALGIPSSAQFAIGNLNPSPEVSWRYHVVPMLIVGNDDEPTVIDPSLLPGPTKRSEWLRIMKGQGYTELVAVPGSYYDPYATPNQSQERIIRSLSEMPAFQFEHIVRACRTLNAYLDTEGAHNRDQKKRKLLLKATQLVDALTRAGKVERSPGSQHDPVDCDGSPFD
jgi:hypothetical protein